MDNTGTDFNKVYWLSQPPEVRALEVNTTPDQDIRMSRGVELAIKGFKIDVPIMLWGWDPYKVMRLRMDFGYTWVPNALQPPLGAAPGLTGPGITPYDPAHPPGGAIKVSIDPKDYPPFDPPAPAVKPPGVQFSEGSPVGVQSVGNLYYSVPGETFLDGQKFSGLAWNFSKAHHHHAVRPVALLGEDGVRAKGQIMNCIEIKLSIGLDPLLCSLVQEGLNKSALDRIEQTLQQILLKENTMSQELDALITEVARNTTVEKSALAAIQGLSAKLTEAGNDPVKLAQLRADLAANDDELAAAVTANTPVATPPAA